ncbi:MAG: SDR family NAD(P)-dependent oxidoreductase [Synechococcaceae bacterium WBA_2_066]|nr:SDR family NAD(P)-dependent oxidoreductase [Synechococcaceae bacterium WB6_1A_059]NCU91970.1 SDR family NAD(P)-dependent oxidoreductase [Synechococcaceae bacterium WB7_1B_046]NCY14947.1 SDR family NAD(P)-dependent oxidoreductase [Synechococcaceae bacterium WB8_1A_041]NDA75189.1 SDR family NAD(P)-dependent oxidoreductase [Synechococcaceae bacterium WB8_3_299]NDC06284.1 SDR family NAD(P)-dependent oxidoreductase [Synechococcaceae bacterium WB9_2_069]NDD20678.1 SDR family NAD(P)-dependent oxid
MIATTQTAKKHILITGASSGIGLEAALLLQRAGHHLTLPCRNSETAVRLNQRFGYLDNIQTPICNLADLNSVASCSKELLIKGNPIDTLALNAGLQYSGGKQPQWSKQGFELTIAVNHLAHQALLEQILPLLLLSKNPRLVITASEVHDPQSPGGKVGAPAGLKDLNGLRQTPGALMLDGGNIFNAEKAYKDSKLCNLLMAQYIAHNHSTNSTPLTVIAWSPGLVIPRSNQGFFRYSRKQNPIGQTIFAFIARDLLRICESTEGAGKLLANLATDKQLETTKFQYWCNRVIGPGKLEFKQIDPSQEASCLKLAETLWQLSAKQIKASIT